MKKLALIALLLIATVGAQAQGYVNFANIGAGVNSPFRSSTSGTTALLAGTGWYVELLAGPTADVGSMSAVGALFTSSFASGYFNGGSRNVTTVTGTSAFAAVRAWSTAGGTLLTWAQGDAPGNLRFASSPFAITLQASQTLPPAVMNNMPSLTLVPEPSTIALGVLGLGGLLFLRRRK